MPGPLPQLRLSLSSDEHSEDWLFDQTRTLLNDLRELDVESVERPAVLTTYQAAGSVAKSGADLLATAALVVTMTAEDPGLLSGIVQLLSDTVRRHRPLEITVDGLFSIRADNLDRKNTTALVQALVHYLENSTGRDGE
ncbi:hypothetical protein [Streptomyces sp. NBC_00328]|uniref:hypothetical protein n=1 Tax=Streptomyces sp. NBC_00328 TaxID=2903646 RepID=UPI002E2A3692|nr:hypothetical protein [Streptomyces sp. NBC_00328]